MKPHLPTSLLMGLGLVVSLSFVERSYAHYETCYENEYKCHTEYQQSCGYETSCHTVPGQQECHQQMVCTPKPSTPNCHTEQECGTNALGQPICKPHTVCDGSSGGGQDCGYVNECHNTGSTQQCDQNYVCNSQPHQVCDYEQVAHQCWVDDPTPVYPDPTPSPVYPDPTPVYPDPTPVYPDPTPVYPDPTPVYPDPTPSPIEPGPAPVDPADPSYLGAQSVSDVALIMQKGKDPVLTFKDKGQAATYKTSYFITILDKAGVVIVNQHATGDGKVKQSVTLNEKLNSKEDHTIVLRVVRSGGELVKDISFIKTVLQEAK